MHQFYSTTYQVASNDLQKRPLVLDDDSKADNANAKAASSDLDADVARQETGLRPPTIPPSSEDNLRRSNSLRGDYIEERLYQVLVNQDGAIPAYPREPSLYPPSESL